MVGGNFRRPGCGVGHEIEAGRIDFWRWNTLIDLIKLISRQRAAGIGNGVVRLNRISNQFVGVISHGDGDFRSDGSQRLSRLEFRLVDFPATVVADVGRMPRCQNRRVGIARTPPDPGIVLARTLVEYALRAYRCNCCPTNDCPDYAGPIAGSIRLYVIATLREVD